MRAQYINAPNAYSSTVTPPARELQSRATNVFQPVTSKHQLLSRCLSPHPTRTPVPTIRCSTPHTKKFLNRDVKTSQMLKNVTCSGESLNTSLEPGEKGATPLHSCSNKLRDPPVARPDQSPSSVGVKCCAFPMMNPTRVPKLKPPSQYARKISVPHEKVQLRQVVVSPFPLLSHRVRQRVRQHVHPSVIFSATQNALPHVLPPVPPEPIPRARQRVNLNVSLNASPSTLRRVNRCVRRPVCPPGLTTGHLVPRVPLRSTALVPPIVQEQNVSNSSPPYLHQRQWMSIE